MYNNNGILDLSSQSCSHVFDNDDDDDDNRSFSIHPMDLNKTVYH